MPDKINANVIINMIFVCVLNRRQISRTGIFFARTFESTSTTSHQTTNPSPPQMIRNDDVSCVIMFIGGSPVGTAGGIKTMTAATLVFAVLAVVQGRKETVAFKKTIPTSIVRRSLAVTVIGFGTLILFSVLLLATNPLSLSDGVFEVTSAIATVGLSRDVTPGLNVIGKLIIILCMYLGRVGPITMFMFFGQRATNHNSVKYADAEIIVG